MNYNNDEESKNNESNFLNTIIKCDFEKNGRYYGKTIITRFPPEPNGYLHIGHAKAICIDFLTARNFGGICNLRMDDTNPSKEEDEYVNSIKTDVKWLGFDWDDRFYYASDYFEEMYEVALNLIKKELAYVCELTSEETKKLRGDLKSGATSPYRNRPVDESIELFQKMRKGEFDNGKMTLRAKIDLDSPNFNMRDPVIYRIMHTSHHRSKDKWSIYPMYDFAHPIEDAIEGITHSLCSLEFEDHRSLYNWVIENAFIEDGKNLRKILSKPTQIEFARLNLDYTVMSKRKLKRLVDEGIVSGWDDPRMPTLSGVRRRGYSPESIVNFCKKIGVSKAISVVETSFLETCVREDLNTRAIRVMGIIEPIKLVIENYSESKEEIIKLMNNPTNENSDFHEMIFSKELFIEKSDVKKNAEKNFFRLSPGGSIVRLKGAYAIQCERLEFDENDEIKTVYCKYFEETFGGKNLNGKKIKSTISWVSVKHAVDAKVNIYDKLFECKNPEDEGDFIKKINNDSLKTYKIKLEPFLKKPSSNEYYQFLRVGYFRFDENFTKENNIITFNRTVALRDNLK